MPSSVSERIFYLAELQYRGMHPTWRQANAFSLLFRACGEEVRSPPPPPPPSVSPPLSLSLSWFYSLEVLFKERALLDRTITALLGGWNNKITTCYSSRLSVTTVQETANYFCRRKKRVNPSSRFGYFFE